MPLDTNDAVGGYHYALEVDSETVAFFSEVDGITTGHEVLTHTTAGSDGKVVIRKTPGNRNDSDITLRRGKTEDEKLWEWMEDVHAGKMTDARKSGSVIIYDYEGSEILRYNFDAGWPSKVSLGKLDTKSTETLIEECTIVHEGLMRAAGGGN